MPLTDYVPDFRSPIPRGRIASTLMLLAFYLLAAGIGLRLQVYYGAVTPLWPPSGLAVWMLWRRGLGLAPVILGGEWLVALWLGLGWQAQILGPLAQLVEAMLASMLLRLARLPARPLDTLHGLQLFLLDAVLLAPMLAAAIGTWGLYLTGATGDGPLYETLLTWWTGDALGILIITPLLLAWWPQPARSTVAQAAALMIATGIAALVVLMQAPEQRTMLFFLLLPFVAIAGLLRDPAVVTLTILMLVALALGLQAIAIGHPDEFVKHVRLLFIGTVAATGYIVSVLAQRLHRLANTDPLTGLPNRRRFTEQLEALAARPRGRRHALLYLDLEAFKLANDTCGHAAGDRLLIEVTGRMLRRKPAAATLARMGGDEFVLLAPDHDADEASALAHRLREALASKPFTVGERSFGIGMRIGIAPFGPRSESPEGVLARADLACAAARLHGGVRVSGPDDGALLRHQGEIALLERLRAAFGNGRLRLAWQRLDPLPGREDGRARREMLLRLLGDDGHPLGPDTFLPVAERYGLLPQIDRWVLASTCRWLSTQADPRLQCYVNLSAQTLAESGFADWLKALIAGHGLDLGRLCLEITERHALERFEFALPAVRALAADGWCFALDDFGAGVASFGYLADLPVQVVKIDGRLVRDFESDPISPVIIEALCRLARLRGLRVVAEWVEDASLLPALAALGVDDVQGFALHRPELLAEAAAGDSPASAPAV